MHCNLYCSQTTPPVLPRVGIWLNYLPLLSNAELQKISNKFRANKMAVNTAKTKFIVFQTRGKNIQDKECNVVFNSNKIGQPQSHYF